MPAITKNSIQEDLNCNFSTAHRNTGLTCILSRRFLFQCLHRNCLWLNKQSRLQPKLPDKRQGKIPMLRICPLFSPLQQDKSAYASFLQLETKGLNSCLPAHPSCLDFLVLGLDVYPSAAIHRLPSPGFFPYFRPWISACAAFTFFLMIRVTTAPSAAYMTYFIMPTKRRCSF